MAIALLLSPFYRDVRGITAATALLIVVLLVAIRWGMGPALVSSLLGAVYLNFFFVPPTLTLQFRNRRRRRPRFTGGISRHFYLVGQLSSRAQRHARKNQELYDQLRAAFDQASQLEAIRQSERLKSALLDSVTHDLRTPLTSIKASATALIDVRNSHPHTHVPSNDPEDNLLKSIVQQTDRLNHFIEGMIELAQIEAGREQANEASEVIPMDEIISTAVSRAEDALRDHEVIVDCQDNLITSVSPRAVSEIFIHITGKRGQIRAAGHKGLDYRQHIETSRIQIAVEDEGPGVPTHLHDRIFDKFFRSEVRENRSTLATGLGLGLAIARGIVEAHGGKIWVEDRGHGISGARFAFTVFAASGSMMKNPERERTVSR